MTDTQPKFTVYALATGISQQEIRYIGMTSHTLEKRLSQHLSDARVAGWDGYDELEDGNLVDTWYYHCYCRKCVWIRSLTHIHIIPIYCCSSKAEAEDLEMALIQFFLQLGYPLVNDRVDPYSYNWKSRKVENEETQFGRMIKRELANP